MTRARIGRTIPVRMPLDLLARVDAAAERDGRTRSDWIRRACGRAAEGTMTHECVICEAGGQRTEGTFPIAYDRDRDSLPERDVYACAACAQEIDSEEIDREQHADMVAAEAVEIAEDGAVDTKDTAEYTR